jgi:hemerythrin-like domain-containing protein
MNLPRTRIDPIAQFMLDHDQVLEHLTSLRRATRSLESHGFSPEAFQKVQSALAFIEDEVSVHNRSEEVALFPVLERYVEGPTRVMREEHKVLKTEFQKLRRAVSRLQRRPPDRTAARELSEASQSLIQLFVNHIHKENHILFPLVQRFLTKEALREVARRMI